VSLKTQFIKRASALFALTLCYVPSACAQWNNWVRWPREYTSSCYSKPEREGDRAAYNAALRTWIIEFLKKKKTLSADEQAWLELGTPTRGYEAWLQSQRTLLASAYDRAGQFEGDAHAKQTTSQRFLFTHHERLTRLVFSAPGRAEWTANKGAVVNEIVGMLSQYPEFAVVEGSEKLTAQTIDVLARTYAPITRQPFDGVCATTPESFATTLCIDLKQDIEAVFAAPLDSPQVTESKLAHIMLELDAQTLELQLQAIEERAIDPVLLIKVDGQLIGEAAGDLELPLYEFASRYRRALLDEQTHIDAEIERFSHLDSPLWDTQRLAQYRLAHDAVLLANPAFEDIACIVDSELNFDDVEEWGWTGVTLLAVGTLLAPLRGVVLIGGVIQWLTTVAASAIATQLFVALTVTSLAQAFVNYNNAQRDARSGLIGRQVLEEMRGELQWQFVQVSVTALFYVGPIMRLIKASPAKLAFAAQLVRRGGVYAENLAARWVPQHMLAYASDALLDKALRWIPRVVYGVALSTILESSTSYAIPHTDDAPELPITRDLMLDTATQLEVGYVGVIDDTTLLQIIAEVRKERGPVQARYVVDTHGKVWIATSSAVQALQSYYGSGEDYDFGAELADQQRVNGDGVLTLQLQGPEGHESLEIIDGVENSLGPTSLRQGRPDMAQTSNPSVLELLPSRVVYSLSAHNAGLLVPARIIENVLEQSSSSQTM